MFDQEEANIRSLIRQVFRNWSSRDPDNNDSLYLANDKTVLFDVAPMKDVGWSNQKKRLREVFKDFERFGMEPMDDLEIHHDDSIGWTTTTWSADILLKNSQRLRLKGRGTFIVRKQDGRWFVIHDHISIPIENPQSIAPNGNLRVQTKKCRAAPVQK